VVAAGDFVLIGGATAFRTDGEIIGIGPTMDIVHTGGITMVAGTIRIGVIGIGTGIDGQI
jgi:hypothetical protein